MYRVVVSQQQLYFQTTTSPYSQANWSTKFSEILFFDDIPLPTDNLV